jgi:hypothetical protein
MGRRHALGASLVLGLLAGGRVLLRPPDAPPPAASPLKPQATALAATSWAPPALSNPVAYLPAQCYAATRDAPGGRTHNGCFACHQSSRAPNYTDDAEVQTVLSVPRAAEENRWAHVLQPPPPVELPDAELLAWIRSSNYVDEHGGLRLAEALAHPPAAWDGNGNGQWDGYTPDCWFHPDEEGFDRSPQGTRTGWRAFAYAPFPGMFWPTNGSAGDVFIRLPEAFRRDREGHERLDLYRINLAILEAFIRRESVPIPPTDERALGTDLDADGVLVAFVWPPRPGRSLEYVGQAATLDHSREGWPAAGLFPRGTEFLHSLRYLDVVDGQVRMAARMKELRYMRKVRWMTYSDLQLSAEAEAREKQRHPDKLKTVLADVERGVGTGTGWRMQAFIEAADGGLRPQSIEETTACMGCHGGVGAPTDSTFSFARKFAAGSTFRDGWFHWQQHGLKGLSEPRRADGRGEYSHWLEQVGGGDDYGSNDEVQARFFRRDGTLEPDAVKALTRDISTLLLPSPRRALQLDRAYLGLVRAQHFELGRDVVVGAAPRVRARLEQDGATGIEEPVLPAWLNPARTASR